jgi:hypothetical protein
MNVVLGLFLLAGLLVAIVLMIIACMSRAGSRHRARTDSSNTAGGPFYSDSHSLGHASSIAGGNSTHGSAHADHRGLDHTSHHHHVGDPAWDTSGGGAFDTGGSSDSGGGGDCGGGGGGDGGGGGGD